MLVFVYLCVCLFLSPCICHCICLFYLYYDFHDIFPELPQGSTAVEQCSQTAIFVTRIEGEVQLCYVSTILLYPVLPHPSLPMASVIGSRGLSWCETHSKLEWHAPGTGLICQTMKYYDQLINLLQLLGYINRALYFLGISSKKDIFEELFKMIWNKLQFIQKKHC